MPRNEPKTVKSMAHIAFRILLIEDNDGDAEIVTEYVKALGTDEFELVRATTLADGLSRIQEETFDIVLLDLHLPDSSGIDTVTAICELCAGDSPLVVVLTGMDDQEMAKAALEDCASDFLIKGEITAKSLIRTLRVAVQRHGRRRIQEIQQRQAVTPDDAAEGMRIIHRVNRVAQVTTDEPGDVIGDLATASHATEVVFADMTRKLDTILESQRRMRADIADLTIRSRELAKGNIARDLAFVKLRSAFVRHRKEVKPLVEMLVGDRKTPGVGMRLDAIEQRDRGWRQRDDYRRKTIREVLVGLAPQVIMGAITAIMGAVAWYISQAPKK